MRTARGAGRFAVLEERVDGVVDFRPVELRGREVEPPFGRAVDRVVVVVDGRVLVLRDPGGEDVRVAMVSEPRASSLQSHASHWCVSRTRR
ncbi:hypothetical protein GCM10009737_31970 [Nocardioides lentus]|uniref:Uncharacterized protein n=1 Tax=Nocardioides lentus TaxID=338077 RepID=A0ABP5B242_9ACTN